MESELQCGHAPRDLNYPEGSMLFDVRYSRKPETFEVIYWNPLTKQLELKYEEPIIDIWFLKEEYRTNKYQISQAEMEKCYPVYCKPSQVSKMIALHAGRTPVYNNDSMTYKEYYDQYVDQIKTNDMASVMCTNPYVFKADFTPDVYFRLRWLKKFGAEIDASNVTFGLVDIETDVLDRPLDIADIHSAPQPINAVSIILPHVKIMALLVLSPRPKSQIHERFHSLLENQMNEYNWLINNIDAFKQQIVEDDPDNNKYLKGYDVRIHTFDFSDEINLIKTVFDYINKYRPMFTMSWNAKFDDNYLIERAKYLGYDPKEFVIPKEFKTNTLFYKEDQSQNFSLKTSRDWMYASTYTVFICQMRLFAAIRKSQQERRSYSLSSVGKDIAKIDKLTNTKSGSFRTFAYTDFLKFLLYNPRDVVVQLAIELNCNDCQSIVTRSYMFATQYSKCFQETHIVRNHREDFYESDGYVQACRLLIEPGTESAFRGAFVAPTEKNAPTGYVLNGKYMNNIIYGALDADASSYYPSTKMAMNMDPMSLIYKCIINNEIFASGQCINHSFNQSYLWYDSKNKPHPEDLSGPIINSYKNGNELSVMYNWFNLPSISEYFQYIDSLI